MDRSIGRGLARARGNIAVGTGALAVVVVATLPKRLGEHNSCGGKRRFSFQLTTGGRGFHVLTEEIAARVRESGVQIGLCHLFLRHTSASLCITENDDPEVQRDLERFAQQLAPDGDALFRHDAEGPDDMPAHVRTLLFGYQLTLPIHAGRLGLGIWQGIYLWEHRRQSMRRELLVTISGQSGAAASRGER